MTKEPITENDRLIAEFMGLRIDSFPDKSDWWFVDAPNNFDSIYHNENESLFSSDWNWLMPIYIKVKEHYDKEHINMSEPIKIALVSGDITRLHSELVWFIKCYNKQKFK